MADNEKIDEMHGMLHAMKPMLEEVRADQKAMDTRQRASELLAAEHGVKIGRLQSDVDGLGRKVRAVETRAPAAARESSFSWMAIVDFFSAAPTLAHFAVTCAIGLMALGAALWRLH